MLTTENRKGLTNLSFYLKKLKGEHIDFKTSTRKKIMTVRENFVKLKAEIQ